LHALRPKGRGHGWPESNRGICGRYPCLLSACAAQAGAVDFSLVRQTPGEAGMDDPILSEDVKENVKDSSVWKRLLFMLLFGFLYSVAEVVLVAVVVFQFLFVLFTGNKNDRLLDLGSKISNYIYQVLRYLTYNNDERPYPFSDWPSGQDTADAEEPASVQDAKSDTATNPD